MYVFFFFKQKTAYEMRISDWSSDVCSSDLVTLESVRLRVLMISRQKPQIAEEMMTMIWPGVAASSPGRSTMKAPANPIRMADQRRQPTRSLRNKNGSAPSRDRVGRYVCISVVCVQSVKKKRAHKNIT